MIHFISFHDIFLHDSRGNTQQWLFSWFVYFFGNYITIDIMIVSTSYLGWNQIYSEPEHEWIQATRGSVGQYGRYRLISCSQPVVLRMGGQPGKVWITSCKLFWQIITFWVNHIRVAIKESISSNKITYRDYDSSSGSEIQWPHVAMTGA